MSSQLRQDIAKWRSRFHFIFSGEICQSHEINNVERVLDNAFSMAAVKPSKVLIVHDHDRDDFADGISALQAHTALRSEQIFKALSPASAIIRPRVQQTAKVHLNPNFHIDRENPYVHVRFLDAIECPHTLVVSNDNINLDNKNVPWFKNRGATQVAECPSGSLVLITQPWHAHMPVCHSEHFVTT